MKSGITHFSLLSKIIVPLLCAPIILGQFGCAPTKYYAHLSEEARASFGTIAVVPARSIPELNFSPTFAKGRLSGAGKGVAQGAAAGAVGGAATALYTVYGVFFLPFLVAGGAIIGGVAGGAVGAVGAVPKAKAEEIEAAIDKTLIELKIQETMAEHVLKMGEAMTNHRFELLEGQGTTSAEEKLNYEFFKEKGFGSVFESRAKSIGFEGGKGGDPTTVFFMIVDTRLIRITDGAEIYSGSFECKSKARKFSVWAENDARLLSEEFEKCYKDLSERIIQEAFFLVDFPPSSRRYQFCMLRPIYPQYEHRIYVPVDSLQPTLKWEPFPRNIDKEADKIGHISRISDVTYDLKIWKVEDDFPVELVYSRQGLSDASHKMEVPLMPSSKYFWSVRARFMLDNQPRATRWGYSRRPFLKRGLSSDDPCNLNYIPTPNYYRFMTAPDGK